MPLERKIFADGGLDTDTTDELLAPNDYRFLLNARQASAEDANVGAVTNVKGNTRIAFDQPGGINTCIGVYEDIKNKRIITILK